MGDSMTVSDQIKETLRICSEATEGPWKDGGNCIEQADTGDEIVSAQDHYGACYFNVTEEDRAFIAHARTGYPNALKALLVAITEHGEWAPNWAHEGFVKRITAILNGDESGGSE